MISLRARTVGLLERYRLRTQKRLSQHFLIDDQVFAELSESLALSESDQILEVGSGPGFLTEAIAEKVKQVHAVEIDKNFCQVLSDRFKENSKIEIHCESILNFNSFGSKPFKAVGNLPYHLSGSILRWFIDHRNHFSDLYFMLQKEVGERITARPGGKQYGVLSILCQYVYDPKILFLIPPEAFLPPPKVESVFLNLTPKKSDDALFPIFMQVVKRAFSHRRKTIFNNFKNWAILTPSEWQDCLADLQIDPKERAENLTVEIFTELSKRISKKG